MKYLISRISIALLFIIASVSAYSEAASEESIRELMELTKAGDLGVQMINQLIPEMKRMAPNAPDEFWEDYLSNFDATTLEALIIPIYQKYLTAEDVAETIRFYKSPTGKKLIRVQPSIVSESYIVGQQWGQELAKKILEKYKAEGYEA